MRMAVTAPEIAAVAAHAWGGRLAYVKVSPARHLAEMARAGQDAWWMHAFAGLFASVRQQRWASVSDEVVRLTGRPPSPLQEVLRRSRAP